MLTTPFLTQLDPREQIKGSRDPLGVQSIWTRLGRHVIANLTTVSTSVVDFTVLLLGHYFVERVAETGGTDGDLATFLKGVDPNLSGGATQFARRSKKIVARSSRSWCGDARGERVASRSGQGSGSNERRGRRRGVGCHVRDAAGAAWPSADARRGAAGDGRADRDRVRKVVCGRGGVDFEGVVERRSAA